MSTPKADVPRVPAHVYAQAACADTPAWLRAVFRGDNTDPEDVEVAKEVCSFCPVFLDCQAAMMQVRPVDLPGVWAGTGEADRGTRTKHGKGRPKAEEARVA